MKRSRRNVVWSMTIVGGLSGAAALWASAAPLHSDTRELVYVIPKGTWARKVAGEKLNLFPSTIRLILGVRDILVLKNEDDVPELIGPVLLMPQQTYRIPARVPSKLDFTCPLHEAGRLTIVVEPAPGIGWPRLRWRVAQLLGIGNEPVS